MSIFGLSGRHKRRAGLGGHFHKLYIHLLVGCVWIFPMVYYNLLIH